MSRIDRACTEGVGRRKARHDKKTHIRLPLRRSLAFPWSSPRSLSHFLCKKGALFIKHVCCYSRHKKTAAIRYSEVETRTKVETHTNEKACSRHSPYHASPITLLSINTSCFVT